MSALQPSATDSGGGGATDERTFAAGGAPAAHTAPGLDPRPPFRAPPRSGARWPWRARNVRLRLVVAVQHWGALLLLIPAVVVSGMGDRMQETPRLRPALVYDASLSQPTVQRVAVANGNAALFPWLAFLVALLLIEGPLFWRRHSATTAAAAFIHFGVACLTNFVVTGAVGEVTKPWVGRLRPDWLHRCRPEGLGMASKAANGNSSAPLSSVLLGSALFFQEAGACTSTSHKTLKDGRLSFPSGHALNTMSVGWFAALYVIWSLHLREGSPAAFHHLQAPRGGGAPWWARTLREAVAAAGFAYACLCAAVPWFIGLSRFADNRHHMGDILGGFLLALIIGTFSFLKAIGQYEVIKLELDAATSDQLVYPTAAAVDGGSGAPGGTAVAAKAPPAGEAAA